MSTRGQGGAGGGDAEVPALASLRQLGPALRRVREELATELLEDLRGAGSLGEALSALEAEKEVLGGAEENAWLGRIWRTAGGP